MGYRSRITLLKVAAFCAILLLFYKSQNGLRKVRDETLQVFDILETRKVRDETLQVFDILETRKVREKTLQAFNRFKTRSSKPQIIDPIEAIRNDCGQLCNTSRPGTPGPFFNHVTANVDCKAIFKNEYIDHGHGLSAAPKSIPEKFINEFTMNNRVNVTSYYFDEKYLGKNAATPVWTRELVENDVSLAKKGTLYGNYGEEQTNALRDALKHATGILDSRVLVIGSKTPWVEACVLEAGAREVVTLEYGRIISKHDKIKTKRPHEFRMQFLNNTLGTFDGVVTVSSVEHSGLGRYGDNLNPWGDIITMARAWCVTREGGSLTIGVPIEFEDHIRFNADRSYGKLRYPYLTTNWKQYYRGQGRQKMHVFTK